jgi:hypothetical protein
MRFALAVTSDSYRRSAPERGRMLKRAGQFGTVHQAGSGVPRGPKTWPLISIIIMDLDRHARPGLDSWANIHANG